MMRGNALKMTLGLRKTRNGINPADYVKLDIFTMGNLLNISQPT
jgi:hypothetical protein